jgi:enamine deaminase RidA (YjgF/YER057c/UK114 family)
MGARELLVGTGGLQVEAIRPRIGAWRFRVGAVEPRVGAIACLLGAIALSPVGAHAQQPSATGSVKFVGTATSPISASVIIPANRASMWISGTTPPVLKADAPAGSRERYGDTEAQATGVLKNIEAQLTAQGLSMKDVVYVRAFLVADPAKENRIDVAGWNAAYTKVFGTPGNPNKTARSTVGVTQLVNTDFFIELEAFAVFPVK